MAPTTKITTPVKQTIVNKQAIPQTKPVNNTVIKAKVAVNEDSNKHSDQRVAVFVDVQNMYYSGKNLFNRKVNFGMLLKKAVNNRKLVRALAYVIKADMPEEQGFRDALKNIGFEVRSKDLQTFYGGNKKGDWDVGIAMDTIRISSKVDTIVLVSGDGDFADLVTYLKGMGCRVEVIGFEQTTSSKLLEVADDFTPIDRKYLI
jgi:uncharacterized LabA/DUF88 family protein